MDVELTEEESSALRNALRTYLADLRMEIADTDDRRFKDGLKHERSVLEATMSKLESAREASELRDTEGRSTVRVVMWWVEGT